MKSHKEPGQAAYGVKQYVAVVRSRSGVRFNVFETGDSRFYLFDPLDRWGCSTCNGFPVRKTDLLPEIRRALRHGWGNASGGLQAHGSKTVQDTRQFLVARPGPMR